MIEVTLKQQIFAEQFNSNKPFNNKYVRKEKINDIYYILENNDEDGDKQYLQDGFWIVKTNLNKREFTLFVMSNERFEYNYRIL